jgi:RNA polymerase sigma-70 factor (ECF subfamily)
VSAGEALPLTMEAIFRQHASRISSLVRRILSHEQDVEDVTQDVLLLVLCKLDTYRGESKLSTWLYRVTVNTALAYRRQRARQHAREASTARGRLEASVSPDWQLLRSEMKACIEQAVRRLPEMYRQPFVLAEIEGMSGAEIGKLLGLTLSAVKSRLHRARQMLRDTLKPHYEKAPRQDGARPSAAV